MAAKCEHIFLFLFLWVNLARSTSPTYLSNNNHEPESDIASLLQRKAYLPEEAVLPKISVIPKQDDGLTYLLSRLSNQELIKLLVDQPKKDKFDALDLIQASSNREEHLGSGSGSYKLSNKASKPDVSRTQTRQPQAGFFRLNEQEVDPFSHNSAVDPNYLALQKIQNLLYSRPTTQGLAGFDSDGKKEVLFDMLTDQLKKLCCKSSKSKNTDGLKSSNTLLKKMLLNENSNKNTLSNSMPNKNNNVEHEHMFLIINDELDNEESYDLTAVDPESLDKNSSVLLLGPITNPLTESQLKLVMSRISNELSKPEYVPLLQQIADGTLSSTNTRVMKSLVSGSETRRYIKPHRCNHQSKLARIYGGPKWLICTGYLNLNRPSLYD